MCDYSLFEQDNRLAIAGDVLVIHQFDRCKGFASVADVQARNKWYQRCNEGLRGRIYRLFTGTSMPLLSENPPVIPAVCVPPGARLILSGLSKHVIQRGGLDMTFRREQEVVFDQRAPLPHAHRDGIRFSNGKFVLLQWLPNGLTAAVVSTEVPDVAEIPVSVTEKEEVRSSV